ncbi:MAG: enoyl-CoA hydratase, partial [Lentisphaerae bacterium]|nr:enoyl-CoA hydratase [Lentisphaerota bacterium]
MELSKILYTESDGIARIALNEPNKLNALSVETWRDLDKAFTKAIQSEAVKVII